MTETIMFLDELPLSEIDPCRMVDNQGNRDMARGMLAAVYDLIVNREIGNYRLPNIVDRTDEHDTHTPERREPHVVAVIGHDDGVREVVDLERLVADDALRLSVYDGMDEIARGFDLVPGYTINVLEENARLDMEIMRAMERDFVVRSMEPPQHQQDAGWWHKFDRKRKRPR